MAGCAEKIVEIFSYLPSINSEGGEMPDNSDAKGVIELVNCKFKYPSKDDVMVLKGVSLKIDNAKKQSSSSLRNFRMWQVFDYFVD